MLIMEFSIQLPTELASNSLLANQWRNFSERFDYHRKLNDAHKSTSIIMFAGHQKMDVINADLKKYDIKLTTAFQVLEIVEKYCLPHFLLLFERFRYFNCDQTHSYSVDGFIQSLRHQVDLCQFGDVQKSILTDMLINGIADKHFRKKLKESEALSFDDALVLCQDEVKKNLQMSTEDPDSVKLCNQITKGQDSDKTVMCTQRRQSLKRKAKDSHSIIKQSLKRKAKDSHSVIKQKEDCGDLYLEPVCGDLNDDLLNSIQKAVTSVSQSSVGHKENDVFSRRDKETQNSHKQTTKRRNKYLVRNKKSDTKLDKQEKASTKSSKYVEDIADTLTPEKEESIKNAVRKERILRRPIARKSLKKKIKKRTKPVKSKRVRRDQSYFCSNCGARQANLREYKHHCEEMHADDVHVYRCDICQKNIHTIGRMVGHLKSHLVVKHRCEICGVCFGRPELLVTHQQVHIDTPSHVCSFCGKNFVSVDRLKNHMRTHSGERRYTCELCGKSFRQKMSFDYHKRWHAGEKPYECDICGHRTIGFSDLNKHKRMHSNLRPYVCDVCGRDFRFVSNLNRHKHGHSGQRKYVCQFCGRSFIYNEGLRDHKKMGRCPGLKSENKTTGKKSSTNNAKHQNTSASLIEESIEEVFIASDLFENPGPASYSIPPHSEPLTYPPQGILSYVNLSSIVSQSSESTTICANSSLHMQPTNLQQMSGTIVSPAFCTSTSLSAESSLHKQRTNLQQMTGTIVSPAFCTSTSLSAESSLHKQRTNLQQMTGTIVSPAFCTSTSSSVNSYLRKQPTDLQQMSGTIVSPAFCTSTSSSVNSSLHKPPTNLQQMTAAIVSPASSSVNSSLLDGQPVQQLDMLHMQAPPQLVSAQTMNISTSTTSSANNELSFLSDHFADWSQSQYLPGIRSSEPDSQQTPDPVQYQTNGSNLISLIVPQFYYNLK